MTDQAPQSADKSYTSQKTESTAAGLDSNGLSAGLITAPVPSSWVQSLSDIPYEDFISAYSVNSLVPVILIRELMPLMTREASAPTSPKESSRLSIPVAYILNVSSREGIFESIPDASAKNGKHVHTNMSKAALNSITQTEAATAWKRYKIAMNSVDPGNMSAAPEMRGEGRECPIGFEDGAARVLWPIAAGQRADPVWGSFLKHFGRAEADVGVGQ